MPTEPFRRLLDPDEAVTQIRRVIDLVSPLLREVINHATWAHQRCHGEMASGSVPDESFAALTLYRNVIEMSDAIDVLFQQSCIPSSIPLLRSSFEASLSLEYLLASDYTRRALAWYCDQIHGRIRIAQLGDHSTPEGRDFLNAMYPADPSRWPSLNDVRAEIDRYQDLLREPHLLQISTDYMNLPRPRRHWYSLYGGPSNIREMSVALNHRVEYDYLYRLWSSVAHASNLSSYFSVLPTGQPVFSSVRNPEDIKNAATYAISFLLRSTRAMIAHFRDGEDISRWYLSEVRPRWDALMSTQITINSIVQ